MNTNYIARYIWEFYPLFYDLSALKALPYRILISKVVNMIVNYIDEKKIQAPKILDACCGTGNFSYELKNRIPDAQIIGIDITPAMIKCARKKCDGVDFKIADLNKGLQQISKSYADVVLLINGFYPLEDKMTILRRFAYIIKPGGLLIISDPKKNAKLSILLKDHIKFGNWQDRMNLPFILFGTVFSYIIQYGIKYPFLTPNIVADMMTKNKFSIIESGFAYAKQNYYFAALRGT